MERALRHKFLMFTLGCMSAAGRCSWAMTSARAFLTHHGFGFAAKSSCLAQDLALQPRMQLPPRSRAGSQKLKIPT